MKYHNITKEDMLNGQGLRVVLWVSGCDHKCKGCHNPITWNANDGLDFDENAKREIFDELDKDYVTGITFSGGDPLLDVNRSDVSKLIKEIAEKYPNKNIWMYTGFDWAEINKLSFIKYIDVLIDGKFIEVLKDNKLHWRGSSNQRIIDVKQSLKKKSIVLYDV